MISRRTMIGSLAIGMLLVACRKNEETSPATDGGVLAATEPVDPAFKGCAHSCGLRSAKDRAAARAQPGASLGDAAYCPVSGAVFRIAAETPHRSSRGETLWFCCEACASWFTQHEDEVRAKRGLA